MTTIKMNLLQGLRQKKRLKEMIARVNGNIKGHNSRLRGTEREVDVRRAIEVREILKESLIDLKLKLQDASRPIQRDILMLAELKGDMQLFQSLDTQHGMVLNNPSYAQATELNYEAEVRKAEVDKKCTEIQARLDELFSKIDGFNTSHFVEVEEITGEILTTIAVG